MKKRLLALLVTVCLVVGLVPAALAAERQPETITLPNGEVREIPDASRIPVAVSSNDSYSGTGTGTLNDPYLVYTAAEFQELRNMCAQNVYERHVKLMADIDISNLTAPSAWSGYLYYFYGSIDGNGHTISGIASSTALVYAWYKGEIKNLTLDMMGNAGMLVLLPMSSNYIYQQTTLTDITVKSTGANGVQQTIYLSGNDQANYSPFLYASGPYFVMTGCTNYADITGNTYGAIFYGYYPVGSAYADYPTDGVVTITNCTNHGNVSYRYAGMVFGNPTVLTENKHITVSGLKNYGELRGTDSVHYFSSDAGTNYYTDGSYYSQKEAAIVASSQLDLLCEEENCPHKGSHGCMCHGTELAGFGIHVDADDRFCVDKATDESNVGYYQVCAYVYVSMYDDTGRFMGNSRLSYNYRIEKGTATSVVTGIYDRPIRDGAASESAEYENWDDDHFVYSVTDGTDKYYWLDNSESIAPDGYNWYLSGSRTPTSEPWCVYVSALSTDGVLLDTAVLTRNGG